MKKFVSFCVAAAVAVSAVPAMAQCSSCGGGAPVFSQPVMSSYAPQATYGQQVYSQPAYSQPAYNQPVYNAPMMSASVYGTQMASGCVGCGSAPMASGCVGCGSAPMASGCGGCGSAPMAMASGCGAGCGAGCGGAVMSGGQIIIWEGGTQIRGTIVSDVLVEGGEEAAATEGAVDAGSNVDVVEPPAAEAVEESPGPDSDEADSTEGET